MATVEAADGSNDERDEGRVMRHEATRGYQRGGDENDGGNFFLEVRFF